MASYLYSKDGQRLPYGVDSQGNDVYLAYDYSGNSIPTFLNTAVLTAFPSFTVNGPKQSLCTDGQYLYIGGSKDTTYTKGIIIKYHINNRTHTTKEYDTAVPFNHGNDLAYNPDNGYIYVASMTSDGGVVVINSKNLDYVNTLYLKDNTETAFTVCQITYDRNKKHFYASQTEETLYEYDQNFNYIRTVKLPNLIVATHQAMETDGRFFYRVIYNLSKIDVTDMNGEIVAMVNIDTSAEPECIAYDWDTGQFYMNMSSSSDFLYRIKLF